jgi:hypothetical protein
MSKACLHRHFKNELQAGAGTLRAEVATRFRDAIRNNQPWALMMAMRNIWKWDQYGKGTAPMVIGDGTNSPSIAVTFVTPKPRPEPLDVTPQAPQAEQPITTTPRLEHRPKTPTPFGWVEEPSAPREQPPSAWDRGSPRGWMR